MSAPCPTPWKIPIGDADEARRLSKGETRPGTGQLKPYHCDCGSWHLSTISRARLRQVNRRRTRAEPIQPGSGFDRTYTPDAGDLNA